MPDRLSTRLKELRGERRQVDVAASSGISQPTITRFENGRQVPRPDQLTKLLDHYGAPQRDVAELVEIATDLRARRRRIVLNRNNLAVQEEIKRAQETASVIRAFSPIGIFGLLQTPGYVQAIFGDDPGGRVRLAGQEQLDNPDRKFVFLAPEGSLGWAMADHARMVEQIEYLISESHRPNVRLGIIPWGKPSAELPINSWEMYDDRAVWTGTNTGSTMLTAQSDVAPYRQLFVELERLSVFDDDARYILGRVADQYRSL